MAASLRLGPGMATSLRLVNARVSTSPTSPEAESAIASEGPAASECNLATVTASFAAAPAAAPAASLLAASLANSAAAAAATSS